MTETVRDTAVYFGLYASVMMFGAGLLALASKPIERWLARRCKDSSEEER